MLQATRPWISVSDIDRGAVWFNSITEQLKDTPIAIVCLTHDNKDKPWILFEAGAVMKGLPSSHICTFLIDLEPTDISGPLSHFNHTLPKRESMLQLVDTLNKSLGVAGLDNRVLEQVFNTYWPQFDSNFKTAVEHNQPEQPPTPREQSDVLSEILENTRQMSARISRLEDGVLPRARKKSFLTNSKTLDTLYEVDVESLSGPLDIPMIRNALSARFPNVVGDVSIVQHSERTGAIMLLCRGTLSVPEIHAAVESLNLKTLN